MKYIRLLLLCVTMLATLHAQAEIGETDIIDGIATKAGQQDAILLLFQARPWNDESIKLFDKKVEFYSLAISSNALVDHDPGLKDKSFRIVVVYESMPPGLVVDHFRELKKSFAKAKVVFVWGEQRDLPDLATKP
jgi:hypothetical protein